ncbi:MAG TPA: polymer-forming cytoskeletal protein [Longimicrobiales bacterium]|nr:polymer-forming cytoskeletal protein [Longimicrobiales bacterium]
MLGKNARETAVDRSSDQAVTRGGRGERRVAAWIGASIVIKGDLVSSEDTTLAGRVEGNVDVRNHALVIAQGAKIDGDVHAGSVSLNGEVKGSVTAARNVEIGESGSVVGDIVSPRLSIAEGAALQGRLKITPGGAQGS